MTKASLNEKANSFGTEFTKVDKRPMKTQVGRHKTTEFSRETPTIQMVK